MSTQTLPTRHASSGRPQPKQTLLRRTYFIVPLGFLVCAALRFYHLGAASLWSDEIFSRYYADMFGLHFLWTDGLSKEPTPPTYYLLLRGWIGLWGDSEAALRSLSAVASVLCAPVTYWLSRELGERKQAVAAVLLFAVCPMGVYFAQETRVYAVFTLAAAIVVCATAVLLRDARSMTAVVVYCVFGTLCLYLHATGVLFIVACGAAVWLFLLSQGASARRTLVEWTFVNALVLCLGVPYFLHTLSASHSGGLDWMPKAGIHQVVYCIAQLMSGPLTPYPWPGLVLAGIALAALTGSLLLNRPSKRMAVILLGVPCVYTALVLIVSVGRPILLPRILAWMVVPLCVLGGRQVLQAGRLRVAVMGSLIVVFGGGLFFQVTTPGSGKEPWRDIREGFEPQLEHADLVVLSPVSDPLVLKYYAPRVKNVRLWDAGLRPSIMNEAADRLHITPISEAEIQAAIESKHSVWIVAHSFDLGRVNALREREPSTLFRVWNCGKAPCVVLAGWQPRP